LVHKILTVFVNHVQKFKWPAKRLSYEKADCRHLNPYAKKLNEQRMTTTETTRDQFVSEYYWFR